MTSSGKSPADSEPPTEPAASASPADRTSGATGAVGPPLRSGGRRWFGSPFWRSPGGIAAVVLLGLVAILVVVELTNRAGRDDVASAADHVASVPLDGRQQADFVLLSGATSVTVRTVDLGDRMLVASTPLDAGIVPRLVDGTGRLELHLLSSGTSGPSAVDIQLNSAVRWGVRLDGGSVQQTLDLTGGRLTGVDLVAGATRIDLSLPRPDGTVPIRLTGGATAFSVHTPADAPARVRVGSGAGSVRVNGVERTGVAAGEIFAPVGWDQATDRYDIDVSAGVSVLTLDRR
jgi:hypothetical protein